MHLIESAMMEYMHIFDFDMVHMADYKVEGCTSCHKCKANGHCVLPPSETDKFQEIFDKMVAADALFIISPVYAGVPSRLVALLERLTSTLFDSGIMNTERNPLLNKPTAIFSYCSCGICDESPIKLLFDKFVMTGYRFDKSTYKYLNNTPDPKHKYNDITDYVIETLKLLC